MSFYPRVPGGESPRVVVGSGDRTPQNSSPIRSIGPIAPRLPLTPYPSLRGRIVVGSGAPTFHLEQRPPFSPPVETRASLDPHRVTVGSGERTQISNQANPQGR